LSGYTTQLDGIATQVRGLRYEVAQGSPGQRRKLTFNGPALSEVRAAQTVEQTNRVRDEALARSESWVPRNV